MGTLFYFFQIIVGSIYSLITPLKNHLTCLYPVQQKKNALTEKSRPTVVSLFDILTGKYTYSFRSLTKSLYKKERQRKKSNTWQLSPDHNNLHPLWTMEKKKDNKNSVVIGCSNHMMSTINKIQRKRYSLYFIKTSRHKGHFSVSKKLLLLSFYIVKPIKYRLSHIV